MSVTAAEVKRELRAQLESKKNGTTPRWAVLEELRLGTGFAVDRGHMSRTAILKMLGRLRARRKNGDTMIGPVVIDDEIARYEELLRGDRLDRRESRIDMFAMDCYESGGYERRAYEIKVSRSDLFAELKDPSKRAPWLEIVTGFYYVFPKDLATAAEVAELAPECGVIYYQPAPGKMTAEDVMEICECGNATEFSAWRHGHGCPVREWEKRSRGRRFNTARKAMDLGGIEPSWSLVASILRAAAR